MDHVQQFYIDGQWVAPLTSDTLEVINPATEEAITSIAMGGPDDVDAAVAAAKAAFESFSQTSKEERLELLDRIIALYSGRLDELADIISQEMGAPVWLAQAAQAVAGLAHLGTARAVLADFEFETPQGSTLLVREPVGVCGMITPWNWPLNQIGCKVGPALAAGCTMVLKPSEVAPLNAILFAEILDEAGVPAGRVQPGQRGRRQRGSVALVAPGHRHDVVHRLDPGGHRGGSQRRPHRQAGGPGAGRQVGQHHPRRRRSRSRDHPRHGRHVHQLGPVLQRPHPHAGAGGPHGRGRRHRRRGGSHGGGGRSPRGHQQHRSGGVRARSTTASSSSSRRASAKAPSSRWAAWASPRASRPATTCGPPSSRTCPTT